MSKNLQNFMSARLIRGASPGKRDERNAATSTESNQGRQLRAQAARMTPPLTKLSHGEANIEDNRSLGDSSIGAQTLKEHAPPRQAVRDTFETDDEHADLTTTTGSFGTEKHYESNGAFALSQQDDRFDHEQFIHDDEEQSQTEAEAAQQHFHPELDGLGSRFTPELLSRVNGAMADMRYAKNGTDSFPATTNGDISEAEVDNNGIFERGQEFGQTYCYNQAQNHPQLEMSLPQRPATASHQIHNQSDPQDLFNSIRQQASTSRPFAKTNTKLPYLRATQNGSPRPKNVVTTIHELQQATSAEPSGQPTYMRKNRLPTTIPHSPDRSIADAINARSDKTLSSVDAQTLSSSNDHELPLDYDHDVLHEMSFEDLANESFDNNPRLDPKSVPLHDSTEPLADRLQEMASHRPAEQATFFAAMPIDEWEQTGAWFIQRFGVVMNQFVESRLEKRRAAKTYEDEVAQRHGEVARKKQRIEGEIQIMKGKGRELLPKTPSKSRSGSSMR